MELPTELTYIDKNDPLSSHGIITAWLKELPKKSVVLDIGTASGTIGRLSQGLDLIKKGIEPNLDWAKIASPYYEEFSNCSIEQADNDFIHGADVVILADVVEHLPDPLAVVDRVMRLQRPNCLLLVSVPNVANIWIRLNLLFGRFRYTDRGILDRTHLHFFTRESFLSFLNESGLKVIQLKYTPIPLYLVHPFFAINPLGRFFYWVLGGLTHAFPTLFGYQFVVKATKK